MENARNCLRGGMIRMRPKEQFDYSRIAFQFSLRTSTLMGLMGPTCLGTCDEILIGRWQVV